jgi:hypothetical protein
MFQIGDRLLIADPSNENYSSTLTPSGFTVIGVARPEWI